MEQPKKIDRSAIAAKIAALLSKTIENGATEAEAMMAAAKASELMSRYEFNMTQIEIEAQKLKQAEMAADSLFLEKSGWWLSSAIGALAEVRAWRDGGTGKIVYFGLEQDMAFATWLHDSLTKFCYDESNRWWKEECPLNKKGWHIGNAGLRNNQKMSFIEGCCSRISARCFELAAERKASRTSHQNATGTALVAVGDVKKSMINDALHKMGFRFKASSDRAGNFDANARGAGSVAGDRAGLGRPVNGGGGVRRLS